MNRLIRAGRIQMLAATAKGELVSPYKILNRSQFHYERFKQVAGYLIPPKLLFGGVFLQAGYFPGLGRLPSALQWRYFPNDSICRWKNQTQLVQALGLQAWLVPYI